MEHYQALIATLALAMGASWASGINLYAAIIVLGIGGNSGHITLPDSMAIVQDPLVIGAAGLMYIVEFVADKTPGVDTAWDTLHTFIRIPAGAMLAAAAVGEVSPALEIAAGLMGGGISAASHITKAGTRAVVNTSPEPFSNWGLSIGEDIGVFGGLWLMTAHPLMFIALVIAFLALAIWLLPKLWRSLKIIARKLKTWLGFDNRLHQQVDALHTAYANGVLSEAEFRTKRQALYEQNEASASR